MKLHLSRSNMQNSNISVHEIVQCGSTTLDEKSFLVIDQPLRVQKLAKLLEENNLRTEGEFILSKYEKTFRFRIASNKRVLFSFDRTINFVVVRGNASNYLPAVGVPAVFSCLQAPNSPVQPRTTKSIRLFT